jgi:hypothetical protein
MKLIAQIAAGIVLAAILSWLFWLWVFASAIPKTTVDVSRILDPTRAAPFPTTPTQPQAAPNPNAAPTCVNFVQMTHGERHCLANTANTPHRAPPTTLQRATPPSTNR